WIITTLTLNLFILLGSKPSLAIEGLKLAKSETSILNGRLSLKLLKGFKEKESFKSSAYAEFAWEEGPNQITLAFQEQLVRFPEKHIEEELLKKDRWQGPKQNFEIKSWLEPKDWKIYLVSPQETEEKTWGIPFGLEILDGQNLNLEVHVFIQSDSPKNFKKLSKAIKKSLESLKPGKALNLGAIKETLDLKLIGEKILVQIPKDFYLTTLQDQNQDYQHYIIARIQDFNRPEKASIKLTVHSRKEIEYDPSYGSKKIKKKLFRQDQVWWASKEPNSYFSQTRYPNFSKNKTTWPHFHLSINAKNESDFKKLEEIIKSMVLLKN
ncbi:MAG: hypothetical protein KDK66_09685, partial [Deltaproteobacteria bacterium]|nr:hypothetical protein [Deltaproteobacteria bacterium]